MIKYWSYKEEFKKNKNKILNTIKNSLSKGNVFFGNQMETFEKNFKKRYNAKFGIAVGSGTDALHLAYLLADIKRGDEVLAPVFTCTATNLPLLYIGAKPVFLDIDPITMNINLDNIEKKITKKTKAIVCVDYGGVPNDFSKLLKKFSLKSKSCSLQIVLKDKKFPGVRCIKLKSIKTSKFLSFINELIILTLF